jgi:hypothetical protein
VAARFRVLGTFVLGSRSLFAIRGVLIDGDVSAGQRVVRPDGIDATVTAVERALSSPTGGGDQTALTFRYTSRAQLAQWQAMLGAGVELALADPTPTG